MTTSPYGTRASSSQDASVEVRERVDVERQLEAMAVALEVLVQLTAGRVDRRRRPQHAHAEGACQPIHFLLGVRVVRDPAEAAVRRRDQERADRRVDEVVGNVEETLADGRVAEPAVEVCGNWAHFNSFRRKRRMPADAACRAAVAFEPSAAPISA